MPKKQPHVPEMHDLKPNREQRRHPDGTHPQDHPLARDTGATEVDVPDVRAKNGGHAGNGAPMGGDDPPAG